MFDINFISEPEIKEDQSSQSWSFINEEKSFNNRLVDQVVREGMFFKNDYLKHCFLLCMSFGLIILMSFLNLSFNKFDSGVVLEEILDLMIQSEYLNDLDLKKIEFSKDNVSLIAELTNFSIINEIEQFNDLENEFNFNMYKKGSINFLSILYPWFIFNDQRNLGDIKTFMNKIIFSKEININEEEGFIYFDAGVSDMVTFLLNMTENNQIQKFIFSISQQSSDDYRLTLYLD